MTFETRIPAAKATVCAGDMGNSLLGYPIRLRWHRNCIGSLGPTPDHIARGSFVSMHSDKRSISGIRSDGMDDGIDRSARNRLRRRLCDCGDHYSLDAAKASRAIGIACEACVALKAQGGTLTEPRG